MSRFLLLLTITALVSEAQENKGSVFLQAVGGKRLTIDYEKAAASKRSLPGGVIPLGDRMPAKLTSEYDFAIGDVLVSEGTYSLFALPAESGWKLIINKVYKAEGLEYDPKEDVGRFDMELSKMADPVEQLTISIVAGGGGKGKIKIDWEKTSATLSFSVVTY